MRGAQPRRPARRLHLHKGPSPSTVEYVCSYSSTVSLYNSSALAVSRLAIVP